MIVVVEFDYSIRFDLKKERKEDKGR